MKADRRAAASVDVPPLDLVRARARGGAGAVVTASTMETTEVRQLMWESAGLFRTREGLVEPNARLDAAYDADRRLLRPNESGCADDWRRFNLVTVARLIARAALRREESRGGHFRADFPARDDLHWKVHLTETRDSYGQ